MQTVSPSEIEKMIYVIRGHKVMIDGDLATLYQVETKSLNRSVRRNIERFPEDFMFELSTEEHEALRYQIGTLKAGRGQHKKYRPLAFTEQGVAMLAGVLNSPKASQVNISIIRTFVKMRQLLLKECLFHRVENLEKGSDQLFKIVFERLDTLEAEIPILPPKRRKLGL